MKWRESLRTWEAQQKEEESRVVFDSVAGLDITASEMVHRCLRCESAAHRRQRAYRESGDSGS